MKNLIICLLFILISACQSPYHVKKADFKENYKKVALIFFGVPSPLQSRKEELEELAFTFAKAELVSRNYEVVGREVTQPIYEEVEQDLGGAFDSVTGEYDKVKSEEIYLTTLRLLKDRLGVDMVLYHYIDEFQVNFTGDIVNWHGQSENVWMQEREFLERFAEALFIQRTGTVGALSYCFTLNSMLDEALYSSCGGLQLLAKMKYIKPEGVKEKKRTPNFANKKVAKQTKDVQLEFESVKLNQVITEPDNLKQAMLLAIESLNSRE